MDTNRFCIKRIILKIVSFLFLFSKFAFSQGDWNCDFQGLAKIYGIDVTTSDEIKAYDEGGQYCGTGVCGLPDPGKYLIHVAGDDPGTPDIDEGAAIGDVITFKINNVEANKVSGSNVWIYKGSVFCDLEVPETPPVADAGGPYPNTNEGSAVNFDGSGSQNAVTYDWDFGDGSPHGTVESPSHTYVDNGTYNVKLTVWNNSGQTDDETVQVNIINVAPSVTAIGNQVTDEGTQITLDQIATFTDPAMNNDVYTATINWGDGNVESGTVTPPSSPGKVAGSHTYGNNGVYTVRVTVNDGDGGSGYDTFNVTVNNLPPENVEAGSNKEANEGDVIGFSGSATDPGPVDNASLTYDWDFGDGSSITDNRTPTHQYMDNDVYTVTLTVSDDVVGVEDNLTVTVSNVAPTANAGGLYKVVKGVEYQFSGSATDPGEDDVLTYQWDMDNDGQYDDRYVKNPTYTFNNVGTYTISLKVTDDDGGWDTNDATVQVFTGVEVTVEAVVEEGPPSTFKITIDETEYNSPETEVWPPGSPHTLHITNYQQNPSPDTQYKFYRWEDGTNDRTRNIIVPTSPITYTATYRIQYYVKIDDGGMGANPQGGDQWYFIGKPAEISVDSAVVEPGGTTRYRFKEWTGDYTGDANPASFKVYEPKQIGVNWQIQHLLELNSDYGELLGQGWYDEGSDADFSVKSTVVSGDTGIQYIFTNWTGSGEGAYIGSDTSASVIMNNPITEIANWKVRYFLATSENPDEGGDITPAPPGLWYDNGEFAEVGAVTTGGYNWVGWSGDLSGDDNPTTIKMNSPKSVTANFGKKVVITISTDPMGLDFIVDDTLYNGAETFIWIENTIHTLSITSPQMEGDATRHVFSSWNHGGEQNQSYTVPASNQTITAEFVTQHYITLNIDPAVGGTISPITTPGAWGNASDTLELKAEGDSENGYGFLQWSGDINSIDNPLLFILDKPMELTAHFERGAVTLTTIPSKLILKADENDFSAPAVFNWFSGEKHKIAAVSPQGDSMSARYIFTNWSDEGAQEHDITIQETPVTFIANFSAAYFLTVESDYGNPEGQGLWEQGSEVTVSVPGIVMESDKIRQKFVRWIGTGNGSVNSSDTVINVVMNNIIKEKAEWQVQYKLDLNTYPSRGSGIGIEATPPGLWYNPGTEVQLEATIQSPYYSFKGWSGDVTGDSKTVSVTIQEPIEITANFDAPNLPPKIKGIPEIRIMEDEVFEKPFEWLELYIEDPNDPIEWLEFTFEAEHIYAYVDTVEKKFRVWLEQDWNGEEEVQITVTDQLGASDSATFSVKVISMEDEPGKFCLIAPSQDSIIYEWDGALSFVWERSENVDSNDAITYCFFFSTSPGFDDGNVWNVCSYKDTSLRFIAPPADYYYYWGVRAEDTQGNETWCDEKFGVDIKTAVEFREPDLPEEYSLFHNFPNPFNSETTIQYQLPKPGRVNMCVFNVRGVMVRTLIDQQMDAGYHTLSWDGRNEFLKPVASGVYFIRIAAGSFIQNRKMVLLR